MTFTMPEGLDPYSDEWLAVSTMGYLAPPRFHATAMLPPGGAAEDPELGGRHHDPELAAQVRTWLLSHSPGDSLLIMGDVGTGKTHLAYRILRHLLDRRLRDGDMIRPEFDVNAISEDKLLKGRRSSGSIDDMRFTHQFLQPALLMIDDLGVAKRTEFVETEMYDLVNHRYENMLTTIYTTNILPDDLQEHLGDRVADRLRGMCTMIVLVGDSLRTTTPVVRD